MLTAEGKERKSQTNRFKWKKTWKMKGAVVDLSNKQKDSDKRRVGERGYENETEER